MSSDAHRHRQRITRRSFLAGSMAAATAGGAAALFGYVRGRTGHRATSARSAPTLLSVGSRGGVLRAYNFDATIEDTLDPHLTQMGPVVNMHSAVFSKLLQYDDERAGAIVPDLCERMPEQPDRLTYLIRLRPGVRFHDTLRIRYAHPTTAGRPLDATDVKYSIERQMNASSPQRRRFFRADEWSAIDKIEATGPLTLTIKMKTPVAPFVGFLAGRHAFIIPREVVDFRDEAKRDIDMVGSGPFMLDTWKPGSAVTLVRNPQWFARDDHASGDGAPRPFLDGYEAQFSPQQDVLQQVVFERKRIDTTGFSDVKALDQEQKTNLADILLEQTDAGGMLASRLLLDRPPFKDDRVRRALHLGVDRRALAAALYPPMAGAPSARLSGAVAPVSSWALPQEELLKRPGYRTGTERDDDLRTARQLLSAALGATPAGDLGVTFAGVPKLIPDRAAEVFQRQMQEALGVRITRSTDPSGYALIAYALTRNLEGASDGVVPFTFGFEDGGVDLDEWVYPQFRSGQPMNSYRLEDPTLDAMLDKQRQEFDARARHKQGLAIQDYLLAQVNARLEYLAPVSRRLTWGYVRNSSMPIWYGSRYKLADTWLDTSHPAWTARPA
ncbi:MAG: ABC transporter substrate-binding protein [Dehalococcoidia bacterium]